MLIYYQSIIFLNFIHGQLIRGNLMGVKDSKAKEYITVCFGL